MKKHHYVYYSYEEWGRGYIGCRSCNCLPEGDTGYFGSFRDKTFFPTEKTILFVCETRQEASEIEIELHDFFDVAVNSQFANRAKAVSTGFDRTGILESEETRKKKSVAKKGKYAGEKNHRFGVPNSEAQKKAHSERMSGENNPMFGVSHTEETKKRMSVSQSGEKHPNYGNTGALNPNSKAIIAIKPDGTQRHFGGRNQAARELEMNQSNLSYHLEIGHVLKCGKFKGWQFLYEDPENFSGVKTTNDN